MKNVSWISFVLMLGIMGFCLSTNAIATDFYWSGNSGVSDNIDQGDNWYTSGNPSSGDNLYFNNTGTRYFPYCNYGANSWFGYIITYNGGGAITWKGDTTYAYKFESDAANNDLFTIQANIGNRDPSDLEINPVGAGGIKITGNVNVGTNDKWLKVYGSSQLEITGVISGNSGVDMTIFNTPTVILSGANTFPDELNIYGGIVDLRNADTLDVNNINLGESSGTQDATIQIGASGVTVDNNITVISGSSGTKYIKNNVADTGEYSGDVTLNDNVTLSAVSGSTLTMSGIISGAGKTVTLNDVGTVVLSGANTFGGDGGQVVVGGGNLKVSANNNLGADPTSTDTNYITLNNWGALWATDTFTLNSNKGIELQSGNGKIYVDATKTLSYSGQITGGTEFSKDGTGTLELGASSKITASQVYIDAGTLWVKTTQPFAGTVTNINLGGTSGSADATLKLGSSSSTRSMDEDIIVRAGSSGTKTIANGNTGNNCNFNGKIYLNDNLTVNASAGSTIVMAGGVDMSATGNQNLKITGGDNVTISGSIEADTGAAELNFDGTGTLLLSGDNATSVDNQMKINIGGGGTLQVTSADSFGDIPGGPYTDKVNLHTSGGILYNTSDIDLDANIGMTIADGVTATFQAGDDSSDDLIINGVISDGGANNGQLKMTGVGVLHLLGTNTYGGATTISAGTMIVNGSVANSAFLVSSGATLMGTGTVGDATVDGTINPGNNGVGELTTGALTMNNGAIFRCELGDCSGNTDRDVITDNGTATINASVTVALDSSYVSNWDNSTSHSWVIISGGISSAVNFTLDETNWDTGTYSKAGGTFSLSASGGNLVLDFTPKPTAPIIDSPTVTNITVSSATLGATLQSNGNATVTDYGIVWATTTAPTTADNKEQKGTTEPVMPDVYTLDVTGLAAQTLIYYRGYAINSAGTNYTAEDSFYTLSSEPTAQVTGFTTTNYTGTIETRLELSWDQVVSANGYIILRSTTATPDGTPIDGTGYTAGDTLGNGVVVAVISGSGTVTYQNNGLTAGTHYYYKILPFGYDGSHDATYNYLTGGTPATDDTWTLANAPTVSPSGVTFSSVGSTSMTISWTKAADSDNSLVVISTSSSITNPKNRKEYAVNTVYGSGETTGANDYTVYSGAGTGVTVSGLTPETTYYVEIFSFNGAAEAAYQYNTTPGTGNQQTTATPSANGTLFKFK